MKYPLLEVRIVTKYFPGVVALKQVSLTLEEGEVLALIGENGAGKSTLMKILAGIQQPDLGKLFWNGKEANIDSVEAAMDSRHRPDPSGTEPRRQSGYRK